MKKSKHTQKDFNNRLLKQKFELLETLQELTGGMAKQIKHDEISPANVKLYKNALKVIERAEI